MASLDGLQQRLADIGPRCLDGGPRPTFAQRLIELLLPGLVRLLVVRDYRGAEHVPRTGGVIVAANHISDADPLVVADLLLARGRHPHFLAKNALFAVPLVGAFLRRALMISVDRSSPAAGRSLDAATRALREGAVVGIYPEGKETLDPAYWPMRGRHGVAALALATGAPVVPVVVWGTQQIRGHEHAAHLWPRAHVSVWAGPPVELAPFLGEPWTDEVLTAATDTVMAAIADLEEQVRGEHPSGGDRVAA